MGKRLQLVPPKYFPTEPGLFRGSLNWKRPQGDPASTTSVTSRHHSNVLPDVDEMMHHISILIRRAKYWSSTGLFCISRKIGQIDLLVTSQLLPGAGDVALNVRHGRGKKATHGFVGGWRPGSGTRVSAGRAARVNGSGVLW